jgi:hypothetical protein
MRTRRSVRLAVLALTTTAGGAGVSTAMGAEILPDLSADPITRYAIDAKSIPGRALLRFDGIIANTGAGDAILVGSRPDVSFGAMSVAQRIAQTEGTFVDVPTAAQMLFETGDGHAHWHTQRFAEYVVEGLDVSGAPTGRVGTGVKTGFCLRDDKAGPDLLAPPPARYVDNCGTDAATSLVTGLQAGFRDVYESEVANQWVDVSGLRAGKYRVSIVVDPDNFVRETDEANNVRTLGITLPMVTETLARQRSTAKRVSLVADGRAKTIAFVTLSHRSTIQATIFRKERPLRTLRPRRYQAGGARISWNQRDDKGRLLGPGVYQVKLVAKTARGSSEPLYVTFAIKRKIGR